MSIFAKVETAPPDAILSLATRFKEDPDPKKCNLGIGAYRTAEGKPWILPSVAEAEKMVVNDPGADKEYVPIDGKPEHKKYVQELIFSQKAIDSGTLVTSQALSGTGSLSLIAQFLSCYLGVKTIHIPDPTWGNHPAIFKRAGLDSAKYTYYHEPTRGFDFDGCMAALNKIPEGEAVLLHSCAQNPTGVDPNTDQWKKIVEVCKTRKLIPVIDNAYQGYASGDLAKDGESQIMFEESGLEYFIAQSFAKNFGMYGERIGYVHAKTNGKELAAAVLSQIKILIRQAYSSPPRHGAAVVYKVLSTPALKQQWLDELKLMSNRINDMRSALRKAIEAKGTPGTWNHITDQIGMFSFTGLNTAQVERMVNEFHIYMTKDGRISVAGLNPGNVDYVADCIDKVSRG
jgi:aspartate aminotransferase